MESIIYKRIKALCDEEGISISKLETALNISNGSIKKWLISSSPSIDKVTRVAQHFNVSIDYLMGRTNIKATSSEISGNRNIISIQRAQQKMPQQDEEKMMKILTTVFDYAFDGTTEDTNG